MNEHILELAKQAGLKKEHSSDREYIGDFDWREFADLIVKECAKVSERTGALNEADYEGEMIADAIKETFGVEK